MKNKNFTMVDNHIIDMLTLKELGVYIMVKKHAGAHGESWVSNKTLEKKLGLCHKTIKKIYQSLVLKRLVECIGKKKVNTNGGEQEVSVYRCFHTDVPLQGSGRVTTPYHLRGGQNGVKGVGRHPTNKIPINKIGDLDITQDERLQKYKKLKDEFYKKISVDNFVTK